MVEQTQVCSIFPTDDAKCKDSVWSMAQKRFGQWPNKLTTIDLLESGLDIERSMS